MLSKPGYGTFSQVPTDAHDNAVGTRPTSVVSQCLNIKADLTAAAPKADTGSASADEARKLGAAVVVALRDGFHVDDHPLRFPCMTPGEATPVR